MAAAGAAAFVADALSHCRLRSSPLDGQLLASTQRELSLFLRAPDLSPKQEKLRRTALVLLASGP